MAEHSVIELIGRIDAATSAAVEANIDSTLDATPAALILDFTKVTFVSSIGLRVLLMAAKRCRSQNARLALHSVSPEIAKLFELSGLNAFFPIYSSREAALTTSAQSL